MPMVTLAAPYAIWVLKQASDKLPFELDEAARIDGATPLQLFRLVYLPLMTPSLVAIGTYALLLAWNEYLYGYLLLSHERTITLAVALGHFIAADDSPWELLMATGLVYALPPAAIYYAFRRYMVAGLTSWGGESLMASVSFSQLFKVFWQDARSCMAFPSTSPTASSWCWSAPRAAASRRCCACSPASRTSPAAASRSTAGW